jgi:hypothetical protein
MSIKSGASNPAKILSDQASPDAGSLITGYGYGLLFIDAVTAAADCSAGSCWLRGSFLVWM